MTKVFYVPGSTHAIDYARETESGEFVSWWQCRTLAQVAEEYPGVTLIEEADFIQQQAAALLQAPQVISPEMYVEQLGMLPPEDWRGGDGFESFKSSEYYSGNITYIYVQNRATGQCWRLRDDACLTHAEIVGRVRGVSEQSAPPVR